MGKELLRLISESLQAWESLNFIDGSGEATQKLLAIFPKETLLKILRLYRIIKGFDEEVPRYKYLSDTFPVKDIQKIKGILERHQEWIGKEHIEDCISYIQEKFERSQKGIKALLARAKEERIKRLKITKPTDEPLLIAVYLLVSHMKAKTKKVNWKLICDFFQEQKIINRDDVHSTEQELRDLYRKTTEARGGGAYQSYKEGPEMKLYTYEEMAEIFKVRQDTIRKWRHKRLFRVYGYRRLGKWAKEALVTEDEVKLLMERKYSLDSWYRRLR